MRSSGTQPTASMAALVVGLLSELGGVLRWTSTGGSMNPWWSVQAPPEDGSCGQFAVQFHVSTSMLLGLKRIADVRGGVSVPEVCRQVIGVFVAQQEGELGALLAAEAEAADYRPSLGQA